MPTWREEKRTNWKEGGGRRGVWLYKKVNLLEDHLLSSFIFIAIFIIILITTANIMSIILLNDFFFTYWAPNSNFWLFEPLWLKKAVLGSFRIVCYQERDNSRSFHHRTLKNQSAFNKALKENSTSFSFESAQFLDHIDDEDSSQFQRKLSISISTPEAESFFFTYNSIDSALSNRE